MVEGCSSVRDELPGEGEWEEQLKTILFDLSDKSVVVTNGDGLKRGQRTGRGELQSRDCRLGLECKLIARGGGQALEQGLYLPPGGLLGQAGDQHCQGQQPRSQTILQSSSNKLE